MILACQSDGCTSDNIVIAQYHECIQCVALMPRFSETGLHCCDELLMSFAANS